MGAFNQDLHSKNDPFYSGDSHTLKIHVTKDGTDAGQDKDISGFDIIWNLYKGDVAKIEKNNTGGGGVTITNASKGLFEVTLDPSDTSDLSGPFSWEAEATSPAGEVQTLAAGSVTIKQDKI